MIVQWFSTMSLVVLAGCGQSGLERFDVSGNVTFDGKPVAKGEVIFEPDPAKGNKGPQARAFIESSQFSTQPGQGAVPGPTIARILIYDGQFHPESPQGAAIRTPYEMRLDLPAAPSTHDLAVPAE